MSTAKNPGDDRRSTHPRPILLRRQSRPAPSHGPSCGPRPPVVVPPPGKPVAAAKPKPKPKPKRKPEPPPPTPKMPLPASGPELPVDPLLEADCPLGTVVRRGLWCVPRTRATAGR